MNQTMIPGPLREKVEDDLREPYEKEVQRILDIGKSIDYAEAAAFNAFYL